MKCPECGASGPFQITFHSWAQVEEDGSIFYSIREVNNKTDIEADDPCLCLSCDLEMGYEHFCKD